MCPSSPGACSTSTRASPSTCCTPANRTRAWPSSRVACASTRTPAAPCAERPSGPPCSAKSSSLPEIPKQHARICSKPPALSRQAGAIGGEALARARLGEALTHLGERSAAREQLDEALALAHASALADHLLFIVHGPLLRVPEDPAEALALVDRAEALLDETPKCLFCPIDYYLAAATACARAGDTIACSRLPGSSGARPPDSGTAGHGPRRPPRLAAPCSPPTATRRRRPKHSGAPSPATPPPDSASTRRERAARSTNTSPAQTRD